MAHPSVGKVKRSRSYKPAGLKPVKGNGKTRDVRDVTVAAYRQAIGDAGAKIIATQRAYDIQQVKLDQAETAIASLADERDTLHAKVEDLRATLREVQKANVLKLDELEKQLRANAGSEDALGKLYRENTALESQLARTERQRALAEQRVVDLTDALIAGLIRRVAP